MELHRGPRLAYHWEKWLWLGGLLFHWSFLIIFLRHLRFFTEPVPAFVSWLEAIDGFFRFGLQGLYITDIVILVAVTYLFLRRVVIPQVRYISLPADYLPLFLILGIASTGILMRYFFRVDITAVKELTIGLVTFRPRVPEGIGVLFYIHLFLVCILGAYFPFSKLVHMGGIFLSPTRNLPNDSRARRHINPWNYPVKVHTYEEYEEEFREKMKMAGLPVEKG
jgi:nitrate reductase gamma subunit